MTRQQLVLAIDTATETTVVALASRHDRYLSIWGSAEVHAPRAAMSRVLLLVEDLLSEHHMTVSDVDEVVVGRGPGSFTGVRIGVATAKGLAHGAGIPLYGVGTLDAVAWRFAGADSLVGVVGDAMRGEVYPALFDCRGGYVERLTADRVARPADVAELWAEHRGSILLAGNGLTKHGAVFAERLGEDALARPESWSPDGHGMLRAYGNAIEQGIEGSGDPGELLPVYTRLSDAEENEAARAGSCPALPHNGVSGEPA